MIENLDSASEEGPLIDSCENESYDGLRRPQCNNGFGCVVCWKLYNSRRYAKMPEFDRHWKELKEEAPDWFPRLNKDDENLLSELCWNFFMRGLELNLGPAKAQKDE